MSVINQMLKDLEERAPEQANNNSHAIVIAEKASPVKLISLTIAVLVILNALGLYMWSLYQENQLLKEKEATSAIAKPNVTVQPKQAKQSMPRALLPKEVRSVSQRKAIESAVINRATIDPQVQKETVAANTSTAAVIKPEPNNAVISTRNLAKRSNLTPTKSAPAELAASAVKPKASMSVSRRQLTSKELIDQKLMKAEKAISVNDLTKAEQLFEDILIIEPGQQHARKKLAALWFGRKSFMDAINLLSQGIVLAPDDSELRSMQAHVYLQQGNLTQAYNTLIPLANLQQQEYQLLIVNISQQISKYEAAIKAYNILLAMQPKNSRWHLGLAIVYDKNSQFSLAVNEYNLALSQGLLSEDSSRFAKERIQVLGVK